MNEIIKKWALDHDYNDISICLNDYGGTIRKRIEIDGITYLPTITIDKNKIDAYISVVNNYFSISLKELYTIDRLLHKTLKERKQLQRFLNDNS